MFFTRLIFLFINLATHLQAKKNRGPIPFSPIVTTEKGIHHESVLKLTHSVTYYSFFGIQYGRVLERFSEPVPVCHNSHSKKCPKGNPAISRSNKHGKGYPRCPQAVPAWMDSHIGSHHVKDPSRISEDQVEDCLFLDIFVPKKVWDRTHDKPDLGFAPTLVWIHGGGFTSGSKGLHDDPDVLLARTLEFHEAGAVIVSINYRLGLFGFLHSEKETVSNVGLLDQRMALSWIQKHIQKFGGDQFRVTVIGEGAGAGAILHHITAPNMTKHLFHHYKKPASHYQLFPFRSAIIQSPTFQPIIPSQSKYITEKVIAKASEISGQKITKVATLRKLSFETLYAVNKALVLESPYGTFTFGPTVDYQKGDLSYVPDFPLRRLKAGKVAKDVTLFVGFRKEEGHSLCPSTAGTDQGFQVHLANIFPTILQREIQYITESLYPTLDYGGDQNSVNRSADALQDLFMGCNIHYLLVFMARSYGFVLETAWASREKFLERILIRGGAITWGDSNTNRVTQWLRDIVLRFGMFATQGALEAKLRPYHRNRTVMLASDKGFQSFVENPVAKHQCRYWADTPYETKSWSSK
ncbi:putative carboxylesterase family protein [Erysiphe necator]|uniref:Putative carboxylesterase family protein n=1 Tax=Uncinula necator TaxID=52586 RepID=A0A0B1PDN4_UNCNE|nr:putative carboxylesterase family protein [Erysiphe necator]